MLESEKRNGSANGNADAAPKRRDDAALAPWQLYMSVIGVLVVVLGGTVATVLGAIWYFDQRNGASVVNIEL